MQERLPSGRLAPLGLDHEWVLLTLAFSVDTFPDIWRYVSALGRRLYEERSEAALVFLVWELDTSAGRFVLMFVAGELVDVMLHPVRPIGAKTGKRALMMLFRQLGGRSVLSAVPGVPHRSSVFDSCEQLLLEMATLEDESAAPAILAGVTFDVSSEYEAVAGMPAVVYPTWFRVLLSTAPVMDVLQLVSGFTAMYSVEISPGRTRSWLWDATPPVVFRVVVQDGQVLAVWSAREQWDAGLPAFSSLLSSVQPAFLFVSAWTDSVVWPNEAPLGKLDALLMRELMSGRLTPSEPGHAVQKTEVAPAGQGRANAAVRPAYRVRTWWDRLAAAVAPGRISGK